MNLEDKLNTFMYRALDIFDEFQIKYYGKLTR